MVTELTQIGAGPAALFRDMWPDLPIVGFGPGNTDGNHHAPDENLRLDDYKKGIKFIIALFYSYAE
jgi:acetylornithine deacetylase/succinyl-diaminopimelate desuccinylase-like protein